MHMGKKKGVRSNNHNSDALTYVKTPLNTCTVPGTVALDTML
jgi:hypothetical protein